MHTLPSSSVGLLSHMPDKAKPRTQFRMPAEWERHQATWLAWPHERSDWPGKFSAIPHVYAEIVRLLSHVERVCILVESEESQRKTAAILRKGGSRMDAVDFYIVPTDRSWCRDFCPIFVKDERNEVVALDWKFNGWAKYENYKNDDAVPPLVAGLVGSASVAPELGGQRVVLEGGSIDVNGAGTLLTTEECLLSDVQARNPGMSREKLEAVFARYLGVNTVLWLRNGIAGDDTHGHVDDLARFTDERTIVIACEDDPRDANYEPLQENLALLREMNDRHGDGFCVETLPMPQPVYYDGQRLPASYANFYIANQVVLMPTFNDPNDRVALDKLSCLFADRTVIGIASTDLVLGLGTLHCMTQQQPA